MMRRRRQEIHVNHERWLISYADFITLLFAFFVVMYSISQVNESKYRVLSDTFIEAFNQPTDSRTNAKPSDQLNTANDVITPIDMSRTAQSTEGEREVPSIATDQVTDEGAGSILDGGKSDRTPTSDELAQISDLVMEKFSELINAQMISVASNELWLQIELKDSILFSSGSAETSEQAQRIFDEIAAILKNYSNPIQVEGFTDNIPISNPKYPTNWELSSARATAIVKHLASKGVSPERLAAVGYGEHQPIASNATELGRAQNRRVTIMIAKRKMDRPKVGVHSP